MADVCIDRPFCASCAARARVKALTARADPGRTVSSLLKGLVMVSATQQFERIRKRKKTSAGKRNKRELRANGTPAFAVHPAGYDAKAADAKKSV
jgi:ribosomal protein L22